MNIISKESKIAIVAITAIAIIYFGIVFLKGTNVFNKSATYYVRMNDVTGVDEGSEVLAKGMKIGFINDITYRPDIQECLVEVSAAPDFRIPKGTTVVVEKEMLGTTKVIFNLGNSQEYIAAGDTIMGGKEYGLLNAASDMMPQVAALMPKLDSILAALNKIVSDPAILASIHNLEYTTNNLRTTTDQVNKMLNKDLNQLVGHANGLCNNLETFSAQLNTIDIAGMANNANGTLANVNAMTGTLNRALNSRDNSMGMLLNDNTIALKLDTTITNASMLLEDLRMHPKRYVHFSVFGKKDK